MAGFFHHRDPAGTCGCHGDDFMTGGSDVLLDRLDRVMKDEFNVKLLGRVGRGQLTQVKFLKRTLRARDVLQLERTHTIRSLCCLDLQTLEL